MAVTPALKGNKSLRSIHTTFQTSIEETLSIIPVRELLVLAKYTSFIAMY